jgi:hypothetical protein
MSSLGQQLRAGDLRNSSVLDPFRVRVSSLLSELRISVREIILNWG